MRLRICRFYVALADVINLFVYYKLFCINLFYNYDFNFIIFYKLFFFVYLKNSEWQPASRT